MGKFIDLTDQKFGRLTVVERVGSTNHGAAKWRCVCECGKETVVIGEELRKGDVISCGCYAREIARKTATENIAGKNKTHGLAGTPVYKEWVEMKRRCQNSNDTSFANYGERGITVCDRWRDSFDAFYKDVSTLPNFGKDGYTLNRIDNNGDYEPNNVEWADDIAQANNRRSNRCYYYAGERYTIAQLARAYNIPYRKLYKRLTILQWNIERAINTP